MMDKQSNTRGALWLWMTLLLSFFINATHAYAVMDSISIKGLSSEGMGIAAWGQGHVVPSSVNAGAGGTAFYNVASRDVVSGGGAAVRGNPEGLISGFTNFVNALNSNSLSIGAMTIQFGRTTLGEDTQGIDWLVHGTVETRYYYRDNTTNNKVKILINGTPILECNTPKVTVNIDYKGTSSLADDTIAAGVGFCRMTKVAGLTGALSNIADAFLNDTQNRAVRMRFVSLAPANSFVLETQSGMYFDIIDGVLELDDDGIRTMLSVDFTTAVRNEDINTISNMLFDNYLDKGETKQMVVGWFTGLFADMSSLRANVNNITYTLIDASTANVSWMWLFSGKNAQGQTVLLESNTNSNIFKKDGSVWKLYGNQSPYDYWAGSVHFEPNEHYTNPNGYYSANIGIEDSTGSIKSVHLTTANGTPIYADNGSVYYLTPNNDNTTWSSVNIPTNLIFGATAPVNLQYKIIVTKKDNSIVEIPVTINGGVTEFATNLSANFVYGALNNFTFTGISNAERYVVELYSENGLQIWNSWDSQNRLSTTIPYTGSTLYPGNYYFYVISIKANGDSFNKSFAKATFSFPSQGTNTQGITFNGSVSGMQLTQMLPNVTVTMVGNPSVTTTTNQNGQFSLSGLPKNAPFALKIVGSAYVNPTLPSFFDTYSAYYTRDTDITAVMPFPLYPSAQIGTQGPKSWFKDGQPMYQQGKGIITGRVVDNVSFNGVGGAVLSCTSAKYNPCPYPITYNPSPTFDVNAFGGTATADNGLYYIYNVDPNDNVTVTATKDGWQFRQRVFGTYADAMMVDLIIGGTVGNQAGGINSWEQRLLTNNIQLSLGYGNGVFVSGGQSEFRRSTDSGVTWSAPIGANDNYNGIRFVDGRFLAAGTFGNVVSSVDNASTWQTIRNAGSDNEVFNAVTAKDSTIVAVGHRATGSYPAIIVTSTDNGNTWTRQEFALVGTFMDVIYAGGKFVAVGRMSSQTFAAKAQVAVSTDGLNWQIIDAFEDTVQGFRAIAYGNNMYVAVGYGLIAYSCDGMSWSRVQNAVARHEQLQGITFGNGRFLAVGGTYPELSSVAVSSSDGINWTRHTLPTNYLLRDVAFGNGYFVVIGDDGDDVQSTSRIYSTNSPVSVVTGTGQCGAPLDYPVISSISLNAGWNFISVPRNHPTSNAIETAFSGLLDNIRIIWSFQSGQWKKWSHGQTNTLTSISPDKGYWIYMNNPATLQIDSWQEARSTTLSLSQGWNLISWQGQDNTPVATALQGKNWAVAWTWEGGQWRVALNTSLTQQMPYLGMQTFSTFSQGKAYWILMQ